MFHPCKCTYRKVLHISHSPDHGVTKQHVDQFLPQKSQAAWTWWLRTWSWPPCFYGRVCPWSLEAGPVLLGTHPTPPASNVPGSERLWVPMAQCNESLAPMVVKDHISYFQGTYLFWTNINFHLKKNGSNLYHLFQNCIKSSWIFPCRGRSCCCTSTVYATIFVCARTVALEVVAKPRMATSTRLAAGYVWLWLAMAGYYPKKSPWFWW